MSHCEADSDQEETHLVLLQELWCVGPWSILQQLIHVATVPHCIISLILCHHCLTLELVSELIIAH